MSLLIHCARNKWAEIIEINEVNLPDQSSGGPHGFQESLVSHSLELLKGDPFYTQTRAPKVTDLQAQNEWQCDVL